MKKEDRRINLYQALEVIAKDKSLKIDTKAIPNLSRGRPRKHNLANQESKLEKEAKAI